MAELLDLKDGDVKNALVWFTDIGNFVNTAKNLALTGLADLLKNVASIISSGIEKTSGYIVKYIGDASLIVFPEDDVENSVRTLLDIKQEIEGYFRNREMPLSLTVSVHLGEVIFVKLQPFDTLDVLGGAVNMASVLTGPSYRGKFVATKQVFEKLTNETKAGFKEYTAPTVYLLK